jgi:GalNAc-alpha-(1->4)-GalNAc-alpha-(1->3)-diNAcBac-PP-undecaprenol alpha-1,4-N-acetyl-D-galactosaminyltransferase
MTGASAQRRPVALYFQRLGRQGGGAERMLCQLAGALAVRGRTVHIVSWDSTDAQTFYPLDPRVTWHKLGFDRGVRDKLRRTLALSLVLRRHRITDLIGFVMAGDLTVFTAARLAGTRVLAAERNAPSMFWRLYAPRRRWINLAMLLLAHRILVQSPDFIDRYPRPLRARMATIPNPVRPADVVADPATPGVNGRYTLLGVGRLDRRQKRPHLLIEAFTRVAVDLPEWDLLWFGDGPEGAALHDLIDTADLSARITLRDTTPEIAAAYAAAHLFAMPSSWEGFPNALAEAMAAGLPAIGYDSGEGVAGLIQQAGGWIAPEAPDPVAGLAETLRSAMMNAHERARRGATARTAMDAFAPEGIYDLWEQVLDDREPGGRA